MQTGGDGIELVEKIIEIIAQAVGIAVVVGGIIGRWLAKQLNGLAERFQLKTDALTAAVADLDKAEDRHEAKLVELDKKMQYQEFMQHQTDGRVSKLEGAVEKFLADAAADRQVRATEERQIAVQLSRIEQNMQIGAALKQGFESLAEAIIDGKQGGR